MRGPFHNMQEVWANLVDFYLPVLYTFRCPATLAGTGGGLAEVRLSIPLAGQVRKTRSGQIAAAGALSGYGGKRP